MGAEARDLRSDAGDDRGDIAAALAQLDSKARRKLSRDAALKKCMKSLGAIEDHIVAVAPATLPRVNQFDGAGFGDALQAGKARLLVLTTASLWIVETRRATGRGGVSGREIKFARIQDDVRINEYRRKSEFGMKTRLLAFDHLRGSTLETEAFDLKGDELLRDFADRFNSQLDAFKTAQAEDVERQERDRAVATAQAAAQVASPVPDSRVDALARLGDLRERGILTEDEFAREKQRILDG